MRADQLGVKRFVRYCVQPVHKRFRVGKSERFQKLLAPDTGLRLLDVGGGAGVAGEFCSLYERFETVTWINICASAKPVEDRIRVVVADGCLLPFPNRSFDWVFSNAVIEHVGSRSRQELFAAEIRRVARQGYFVTTPNRYFPVEPHALLPWYQFYPSRIKKLALRLSPGYMTEVEHINLVSRSEMQALFPEATVISANCASCLIAYYTRTC
jgi:ubiquinone/menaquinone biosynthesis C-methylase UbiE